MSGISTVAIKDGHEGNRPSVVDGNLLAADRLSRLGTPHGGGGYFDMLPTPRAGSTPSSSAYSPQPQPPHVAGEKEAPGKGSPASSNTTSSVAEARKEARFIGGMTYDDSVVDTTNRSPIPVLNKTESGAEGEVERKRPFNRRGKVAGKLGYGESKRES